MSSLHRAGVLLALVCAAIPFEGSWAGAPNADPHLARNSLYRELKERGIALDQGTVAPLPAPLMPSGLSADEQMGVLRRLAADDYPLEELTRESVVAPHVLKIRDLTVKNADVLGRGTSLWFCAHGSFAKLDHRTLVNLFQGYRRDAQLTFLTEADVKARGLTPLRSDGVDESYCRVGYTLLERVQTQGTYRLMTSRADDSVVLAVRLAPEFLKDRTLPNVWRALTADEAGTLTAGPPQPYDGVGMVTRITRMKTPGDLLFVESHQVFAEPAAWFGRPNVLRSKLPLAVQSEVRAIRREILKLGR